MRSIPQSLLWETFARGRWSLPGMFLLGNGLPFLVYSFLFGMKVNAADPAFIVLQFSFLPLAVLQFAIGTAMAQGPMSRFANLPISSNAIVAWHTATGAAILAVQTGLSAWMVNSLFQAEWPILGSMLFAATTWSAIQLLQLIPTQPSLSGMGLASFPLMFVLFWVMSRYGSWLSAPTHYWREVTIWDSTVTAMIVAICYAMTITGVRFARCGESLPRLGVSRWLMHQWESITLFEMGKTPFRSAVDAQSWYEFKLKGWGLPFITAIMMVIILSMIAFSVFVDPNKSQEAYKLLLGVGAMQSVFALFFGLLFAIENNSNPGEKRDKGLGDVSETMKHQSMGAFLAVRPLDNRQYSSIILWVVAKSVAISFALWFGVLVVALFVLWFNGRSPTSMLASSLDKWLPVLNPIGTWICLANTACIAFVAHRAAKFIMSGFAIAIGYVILTASIPIPRNMVQQMHVFSLAIISVLTVVFALWVFFRSHRAGLLAAKSQAIMAILFSGILISIYVFKPENTPWVAYPISLAIACLFVLPFAAMPLAIRASRHR